MCLCFEDGFEIRIVVDWLLMNCLMMDNKFAVKSPYVFMGESLETSSGYVESSCSKSRLSPEDVWLVRKYSRRFICLLLCNLHSTAKFPEHAPSLGGSFQPILDCERDGPVQDSENHRRMAR